MNKRTLVSGLMLALLLLPQVNSEAKFKLFSRKKAKTEAVDSTKVKKESKYDKLFKGESAKAEGMITLHLQKGKVYFELPIALLGRDFVMGSTIKTTSDNSDGIVGSKPLELKYFTFTKQDSTIQFRSLNTECFSMDENIRTALSKSYAGYVEKAFKIKTYSPDSSAVVFDATSIFLSDDKDMGPFSEIAPNAQYSRDKEFKSELSYIAGIKAFSDNVSVTSSLTYTYDLRNDKGEYVAYKKPFTAELTRSILLLSEEIYHPRMADPRIGVFFTPRQMLGDDMKMSRDIYLANRWRIEPSDTTLYKQGIAVEPKEQIVWYVDSAFPEWWQPYIFEAVEQWNELFEEIGLKNVIKALPFPKDDPEFDPDNIRYNCIRYAPINVQNATGPSWVDPRSGEIINASVYVYHDIIKLIGRWRFVQTAASDPDVRSNELPREVVGDALRYVVAHEIGHTLGFMHNMSASSVIAVEDLRSPEVTSHTGTTTSIMDYARFNYVAQPGDKERGVKLTPPRFGDYDRWLVKWTYTPVFDMDFAEEAELTSRWISEALTQEDYFRYGKQQFYSLFFDPRSQTEDLGDDVIKASRYGVKNLKYIMGNYMDWLSEGDDEYENRLALYNSMLNQYLTYAQHIMYNVGGIYKNEIKSADTQFRYKNIPASEQKAALDYLFELWKDTDWIDDKSVLSRLPVVGSPKRSVQQAIESMIFNTPVFAAYSDGVESRQYSVVDCLYDIADKVFAPSARSRKLSASERSIQANFIYTYMSMAGFPIPGTGSSKAIVSEGMEHCHHCETCWIQENEFSAGTLSYSPINGFEWLPRYIFNMNLELTKADIYGVLQHCLKIMTKARQSADQADKAHYTTLIESINYSLKK